MVQSLIPAYVAIIGKDVDFSCYGDIHVPAALLKKWLRELPEPLLTFEANKFLEHFDGT